MVLKSCKEQSCIDPWGSLHPEGDVESLRDALSTNFDDFYRDQVKVEFDRCERGYFPDAEGPQDFIPYEPSGGQDDRRRMYIRPDWSLWV